MKFIKTFILLSFIFLLSVNSTFAANYSITASAGAGGSISPAGATTVTAGQSYIAPSGWVAGTPATSGYYSNPGQPYIAPSGYHPAQSYIPPTEASPAQEATPSYAYGQVTYSGYHFGNCYTTSPGYPGFLSGTINWNSDPGQPGPGSSAGGTLIYGTSPPLALSWTATEQLYSSGRYCLVYTNYYIYVYGYGGGQPYIPATEADPGQPAQDAYYDYPGQPYIAPSGWVAGTPATSGYYSNPGQAYIAPANKTFTIIPDSGSSISSVVVDGVNKGAIGSYTFNDIQVNHSISASFTKNLIPSGSLTAYDCIIAPGASSCTTALTLNVFNPIIGASTNVTKPTNIEVISNSTINGTFPKTVTGITVSYPSTIFYLNHNADTLGSKTINASCISGNHWGTSSCVPDNTSPNAITLDAVDTNSYTDYNLTFKFVGSDPDATDKLIYGADWNKDGIVDEWTNPYVDSGTPMYISHIWSSAGTYTFQSQSKDDKGGMSSWMTFTVNIIDKPLAPDTTFTLSKEKIEFGEDVTLTWSSPGAELCIMDSDPKPSISINSMVPTNINTLTLKPTQTTVYHLTCSKGGMDTKLNRNVVVGKINPSFIEN